MFRVIFAGLDTLVHDVGTASDQALVDLNCAHDTVKVWIVFLAEG